MSNRTFSAYCDFPINPGFLYIDCVVCGLNYSDSKYAKEWINGNPSYFIESDSNYIHCCGAECATKILYPTK